MIILNIPGNLKSSWKSKGLSDKVIKSPTASGNSLAPALSYVDRKIRVTFTGSCLKQDKNAFAHGKAVNIFIAYEISVSTPGYDDYPVLERCLFGQNVIFFGVGMSSSIHFDNKEKIF